jgi:phage gpG-like protein
MDIKTTFHGDDELRRGMDKTAREIPGRIYSAMVQACSLVENRAKTYHLAGYTLKAGTHVLQRSVKSRVGNELGKVVGRVGSPIVYAAIHEFGGIIRPKNAKYLVFQINGTWIRTKQVTMPKREWLSKSLNDVKGQIEKIFGREIKIAIG